MRSEIRKPCRINAPGEYLNLCPKVGLGAVVGVVKSVSFKTVASVLNTEKLVTCILLRLYLL